MKKGTTNQSIAGKTKAGDLFEKIWLQSAKNSSIISKDLARKAFVDCADNQSLSLLETFSQQPYKPALYSFSEKNNKEYNEENIQSKLVSTNNVKDAVYRGAFEDLKQTYQALCTSLYQKAVKESFSVEALIPFFYPPSGYAVFRGGEELELEKEVGTAAIYPIILGVMQHQKIIVHDRVNASVSTVDIDCKEGSTLNLIYSVHSANLNSIHFQISCAKNATVQITVLTTGVERQNITYSASVIGEGGHVGVDIRAGASASQKVSIDGVIYHKAQNTTSDQTIKNIGAEASASSFDGTIYIHSNAKHSNAYQKATNLLIGKRAKAIAKPKLEIFTDDVKASHGSTTSYLDKDVMQYFASRGLATPQAMKLILKGFLCGGLDALPQTIVDQIESYVKRVRYEV